jgi:[ribosomal protein S5]-alanine N-acetyltransferase
MRNLGEVKRIETARMILRKWSVEDASDVYEYAKNPNVGPHAGWKPHESTMESFAIITELFLKKYHSWAMELKENNKVIGSIGFEEDPRRVAINCMELGYALAEDQWGKGLMTEAVQAVIRHGFEDLGLDMISIYRNPRNFRSGSVIEKCGFVYEGTLRKSNLVYDGEIRDTACYSMTKGEYKKLQG